MGASVGTLSAGGREIHERITVKRSERRKGKQGPRGLKRNRKGNMTRGTGRGEAVGGRENSPHRKDLYGGR